MVQTWSSWKRFPDVESGDSVEAPIGPGVYEVRHSLTGQVVAFAPAANVAQALSELKPEVQFEKIYDVRRPGGDRAFLFRVKMKRAQVELPSRDVFVLVGSADGPPRVKSFSFDPSGNHTSGTP